MSGDLDFSGLYGATYDWIKDATSRLVPWVEVWQLAPPEMWIDKVHDFVAEELLE